jgi:hypothetical protein
MRATAYFPILAIFAVELWACGSSDDTQASASSPDGSLSDSPIPDGNATMPTEAAAGDAVALAMDAGGGIDADGGAEALVGDSATLDSSRDSQAGDGPTTDTGLLDGPSFGCGYPRVTTCVAGMEYCFVYLSGGELPMRVGYCTSLTTVPCSSASEGCNCNNLPLELDASGCTCNTADAAGGLTLDCS